MENDLPHADGESARPEASAARDALEQLDADASRLAARVVTPWWYHLVLGVIVAAIATSQALPGSAAILVVALGIVLLPTLTATYTRRYGLSTTQPAGPRSKRLLLATLVVLVVAMAASLGIKVMALSLWWALIPGIVAFCATVMLGRRYDDALREELAKKAGRTG